MIKPENLSTLLPASEAAAVADAAIDEQEEGAVARAINYNANTGETCTEWTSGLSDKMKAKLESKKYKVIPKTDAYGVEIPNMYYIKSR